MPAPNDRGDVVALVAGDVNADGTLDLVTLDAAGEIRRASSAPSGWNEGALTSWSLPAGARDAGSYRLLLADLDNNGSVDVLGSGAGRIAMWLSDEKGGLQELTPAPAAQVLGAVDLNADGMLDLLGLAAGRPVRLLGRGSMAYHW